jgi:uncharacterized protein YwgA
MNDMQRSLESIVPLYLVYLSDGTFRGRTRLQKLTFLIQKKTQNYVEYDFKKDIYGPCSYKLFNIIDNLVTLGLLQIKTQKTSAGNSVVTYLLSPLGRSVVQSSIRNNEIPSQLRIKAKKIFKEYGSDSLIELVKRVYDEYPAWTVNSIFFEK